LHRFEIENKTFAKITTKERLEKRMVDGRALREAIINAIVHNDYTREVPPLFEIFSDRIVITSYGGLVRGLSQEEFFKGCSMIRNRELMRVFKDLELVEQLGSGMRRIMEVYDESIFEFTENFMFVTFPFAEGYNENNTANSITESITESITDSITVNELQKIIIMQMQKNPKITTKMLAEILGIADRNVKNHIKVLKQAGIIDRFGSAKGGHWVVNQKTAISNYNKYV
jgi:predicted HTH transcriptional regulator